MRYFKHALLAAVIPTALISFNALAAEKAPSTEQDKFSYSLGVKTAENFLNQDIKINLQQFYSGLSDVFSNKKPQLTEKEMEDAITKFQKQQMAKINAREKELAVENLAKSKAFFAENKNKPNVTTLPSGLQYTVLTPGKGNSPKLGDSVTVNYRGTLLNGTEFDSSYKRNESTTFPLENLIPGWQEALLLMKPGAKWKVYVPPQLAYGDKGAGQAIEPNSALIFEIELVSVKPK